jgi:small-conductance mechanosensitive channel
MELRAWSKALLHKPAVFRSDLNFAIVDKLRENNIRMTRNQKRIDELDEPTGNVSSRRRKAERTSESDAPNFYQN